MSIAGTTRLLNAPDLNVKDFGARGNGSADDYHAFAAAQNQMDIIDPGGALGFTLSIPFGEFTSSRALSFNRPVILRGSGSGDVGNAATTLHFPSNSYGVIINSSYSSSVGTDATHSVIKDMRIRGDGKDAGRSGMHGIVSRTRVRIENVLVNWFSGNGIHIVTGDGNNVDGNTAWTASTPYVIGQWVTNGVAGTYFVCTVSGTSAASGPGPVAASGIVTDGSVTWKREAYMGNANNWYVGNSRASENGGHGLYCEGDNVNAGTAIQFDASVNGGWGIYDKSFLGNTYLGCHCATNGSGPYTMADHGNNYSLFLGTYTEADQSPAIIHTPGQSIGGIQGAGITVGGGLGIFGAGFRPNTTLMTVNGVTQYVSSGVGLAGTNSIYSHLHTTSAITDNKGVRSFSHEGSDQWSIIERTDYAPSMRLLAGDFPDTIQMVKSRIPARDGAAGSVPSGNPGHASYSYFGSPLLGAAGTNTFYVGDVIWNLNYGTDNIKGWVCKVRCGSGWPWAANNSPEYKAGATVTPTTPNGYVYRRHSTSTSNGSGSTEPTWPTTPGQLTALDGGIYWECWGSTSTGLVAL